MKTFVDLDTSEARIEIIPLVDVVFCVLTFFILAAVGLTRVQGIGIDLPKTQASTSQFGDKISLQVNSLGQVFLNNETVTDQSLIEKLTNYRRSNPAGLVVVDADSQVRYERVLQVLDVLAELGISRVSLGTEEGGQDASPIPQSPLNPFSDGQQPPLLPNPLVPGPSDGSGIPPAGQPSLAPIQPSNPGTSPNEVPSNNSNSPILDTP